MAMSAYFRAFREGRLPTKRGFSFTAPEVACSERATSTPKYPWDETEASVQASQPGFIPSPCGNTEDLTCVAIITDYLHTSKLSHFYIIFNTNIRYFPNTVGTQCEDVAGIVRVILTQSCSLDPNSSLVTIFSGRALLTFNITEMVVWVESSGWWRTELSLWAEVWYWRRWRSRKPIHDDQRKELFAHFKTFLHIVFLSYSQPPWPHLLRTSSQSPPFLNFLLPSPFLARNARNVFYTPSSNQKHLQSLFGSLPENVDTT